MNELWRYFADATRSRSTATALSGEEGCVSFGDLFRNAERLAIALQNGGVREGDRAGIALPNSVDFVVAFLALTRLHVTAALISVKYSSGEVGEIVAGIPLRGIITTQSYAPTVLAACRNAAVHPIPGFGEDRNLAYADLGDSRSPRSAAAGALIKFTSGSTGGLKGILLSPENVVAECRTIVESLSITDRDTIHAPVPLCHSYGFDLAVLAGLGSGAKVITREVFVPRLILNELKNEKVSVFLGIPAMYRYFADIKLMSEVDLTGVRYFISCTAPLAAGVIRSFYERYRVPVCQHYGSSETGAVTIHEPSGVLERIDSVGRPMKNVRVMIVDGQGEELAPGEEGEIAVSSPAMSLGYVLGAPSPLPFRKGLFLMGDCGITDEEGFLYLRGRTDDIINVAGMKVSPHEVEKVLELHPAVWEAAVIGVKDRFGQQIVYAVVSLRSRAEEADLRQFCREHLADYKIPRHIEIRKELPRGPTGKVRITRDDIDL